MNQERWERVKELLAELRQVPSAERAAFLERNCAGDAELATEVMSLLEAHERVEPRFLTSPELRTELPATPGPLPRRLGEFELLEELGRGGNGVVYRARQSDLGRIVAVKVLPVGFTTSQRQIARFVNEALLTARLDHPGIVKVFTTGEAQGEHYFAMEYVRNGSLADELERQRLGRPGKLPALGAPDHMQQCARRVAELALALQAVHELSIWHRDLKPQNILIGDQGELRLVDFGLAKERGAEALSRSGEILGTPHYMSPEQARAATSDVDHRTDVYSLGVVLYEMLTLARPFHAISSDEVVWQILHREPVDVRTRNPRIPRDLALITATAMAKSPAARYPSARALAEDLQRFLRFESIVARAPSPAQRMLHAARRHRLGLGAAGLLVLGLIGGRSWVIRAEERAVAQDARAEAVALAAVADWDALEDERLMAGLRALDALAGLGQERELCARLRSRFAELHERWFADARERMARGRQAVTPEQIGSVDDAEVLAGFLLLTRGLKVFGSTDFAGELRTDAFHPRVSLRAVDGQGRPLSGVASYRLLDQATGLPGPRVELGALPIEERPIAPGFYRFAIEVEGAAQREFTRLLPRGRDAQPIVCSVRPDQDLLAGMRLVQGGTLAMPTEGDQCPLAGKSTAIEAFYVDEAEVSNREFRRFLEATGTPPPLDWSLLPTDGSYDDRPVVSVSWYEALAYAEWAGKRLVAHGEWELAARGPDGAFLAALAPGPDGFGGNVYGKEVSSSNPNLLFQQYLENTQDVRDARGLDLFGTYHMLGNVSEWSESLGFESVEAGFEPRTQLRLALSSPWYARDQDMRLDQHFLYGPEQSYASATIGFRCARSARP